MAHLLGAEALHLEYPNRVVFGGVTLGLDDGDRIGIVGRNGDGKSSLLGMLAGSIAPDAGRVTRRTGLRVGVVAQSDELPPGSTVRDLVIGDRAEHEWAGDARIRAVLAGLLGDLDLDAPVATLSGGQRRRVALAVALVGEWDVLMLDEPTNHLDVEGIAWLAEHLRTRWPGNQGALIVVTHDRWFLDAVCTTTWEVHDGIVEPFEGGYAAYILQRVERDRMAAATETRRRNLARKELAWLRRGAPARTSKPKFRIDAATVLIENEPPVRDPVRLQALAMQRLGKDVVDLEDASVTYPATDAEAESAPVLQHVTWRIAPGERTAILGRNGAGKSTLLALVAGTLQPTGGRVKRGTTVRVAVLDQRLADLDELADDRVSTVVGRLRSSYAIDGKEVSPGHLLERLGFTNAQLATPVRDLSGGQRRRLQLLLTILEEPNVLILDEPTNDLDTDMLAAMEDLLDSFAGTLIVVSHDRYLVERVTDQQYAIVDGALRHLPRGVDEYLELRRAAPASAAPTSAAPATTASSPAASGAQPLSGAERRALEKESAATERRIAKLGELVSEVHGRMATADQSDFAHLNVLMVEASAAEAELADAETRWLELQERLQ